MKLNEFNFNEVNLAEVNPFDLKYSMYLVKNNLVSDIEILPDEKFGFKYLKSCCGEELFTQKESLNKYLDSNELPNSFTQVSVRKSLKNMSCSNKRCKFETCPILLAGFMLLDKTENKTFESIQEEDIDSKRKENLINSVKTNIEQISIQNEFLSYINRLEFLDKNKRRDIIPHILILKGDNIYEKKQIANIFSKILFYYGLVDDNDFFYVDSLLFDEKNILSEKQLSYIKNLEELGASKSSDFNLYSPIIRELFRLKNRVVNNSFIILDLTDKLYMDIIEGNNVRKKIADTVFVIEDYSIDKLINIFNEKMKSFKFSYEIGFEKYFVKYLKNYIKKNPSLKNMELIDTLIPTIVDNVIKNKSNIVTAECLPKVQENKNDGIEFDTKLNNLIGLDNVKEDVQKLAYYLKYLKKVENKISPPALNLHSLFMGNPGTGKTTVARIYTEILYDLGYIKENKLIEVSRQDLVAGYVGQTAIKTQSIIDKSLGGVLFIDEAYTLTPTSSNDFGAECIATLNKAMEDNKKDFVVIFAGYKKDMEYFIKANDGLLSRINNKIEFKDYTEQELYEIFKYEISNIGLLLSEDIETAVKNIIQKAIKIENFGNGRFIKKMAQLILIKHSFNTKDTDDEKELLSITKKDIPSLGEIINKDNKISSKIGFNA